MKTNSKKLFYLFVLIVLMPLSLISNNHNEPQENNVLEISNVSTNEATNFGTIYNLDVLYGYYYFTSVGKTENGNYESELKIYDLDLKYNKSIKIETINKVGLFQVMYNGNAFLVTLLGAKGNYLHTYSKEGQFLGEKKELNKGFQMPNYTMGNFLGERSELNKNFQMSYYAMGNYGFMKRETRRKGSKLSYLLEAYNNNLEPLWSSESEENANYNEGVDIKYTSSEFIGIIKQQSSRSILSYEVKSTFYFIDTKSGKKLFEIDNEKIKGLNINSCRVDEGNKFIYMVGEYYNLGSFNSEGLYLMKLDFDGNVINEKRLSWSSNFKSITTISEGKEIFNNISLFIHSIHWGSDDKIYIVAEQFKSFPKSGLDANLLAGMSGGAMSTMIFNIVYMVFDKDFTSIKNDVIKKRYLNTDATTYANMQSFATGFLLKPYFDYLFSYTIYDGKAISVIFDDSKEEEKGKIKIVRSVNFNGGEVDYRNINLQLKQNEIKILPSKNNHLLFLEYNILKRKLIVKMETLNL
jgi:hypothetical protein